jgi:hypothetical protein
MIPLYRQTRLIHVPVKLKTPVTALLKTVPDSLSLGQVVATHWLAAPTTEIAHLAQSGAAVNAIRLNPHRRSQTGQTGQNEQSDK